MVERQMMRGTLRWVAPEDGGRKSPLLGAHLAVTAYAPLGEPPDHWSIVLDGIAPGQRECEVHVHWLAWENVDFSVHPGTVRNVCEGSRVVAHLEVHKAEAARL